MAINIPKLREVISLDRITEVLVDAMINYPKLMESFPDKYTRRNALEATVRFYGQYDMYYGKAYTLDEDAFEVALILESEKAKVTNSRCLKAGCYSMEYQSIKERMSAEDRKKRVQLFRQIEKLEKTVPVPKQYLYIDFLGVVRNKQGEGRGTKLMEIICEYADEIQRPIVLFTNSKKARSFYEGFGFEEITTVTSDKYGFTNVYLMRAPKTGKEVGV